MHRSVREVELVGRRWEQAGGKGRGRCTLATIPARSAAPQHCGPALAEKQTNERCERRTGSTRERVPERDRDMGAV